MKFKTYNSVMALSRKYEDIYEISLGDIETEIVARYSSNSAYILKKYRTKTEALIGLAIIQEQLDIGSKVIVLPSEWMVQERIEYMKTGRNVHPPLPEPEAHITHKVGTNVPEQPAVPPMPTIKKKEANE